MAEILEHMSQEIAHELVVYLLVTIDDLNVPLLARVRNRNMAYFHVDEY